MLSNIARQARRMSSGVRHAHILASCDSRATTSKPAIEESSSIATDADLSLLRRGDFFGVASRDEPKIQSRIPEIALSQLQDSLRRNFRVRGETTLGFVLQLEAGDASAINAIRQSPGRWLPMIISSCGYPMSNLDCQARNTIFQRLWTQLDTHSIPIDIDIYNKRLSVLLENEVEFSVAEELANIQETRCMQPNQETFHMLIERLARMGDIDGCRDLVYKMAGAGCVVDAKCNASLVYCFALRGHNAKADSLTEQSASKYDAEALNLALGACVRAAAARGDTNRLRQVLRRSVDEDNRLLISHDTVFDTIWLLARRNHQQHGAQHLNLVEQMLERTVRPKGFFRYLLREIERHIAHEHYYTAITLLEDTRRIADCLRNQRKSLFLHQVLSRMCRQMIRCKVPISTAGDVANRVVAVFKDQHSRFPIHETLLYSAMMFRGFTIDERLDYFSALVDTVDSARNRPHLIFPLMTSVESASDRLKVLFRCANMGYKDISQMDTVALSHILLTPLYEKQMNRPDQSRLDKCAKILKSYGVPDTAIWNTFHSWWKIKSVEEARTEIELHQQPFARELQGWLKSHYSLIFEHPDMSTKVAPVNVTYERLKSMVDSRDSAKALTFVNSYGWPEDTNFQELAPSFLEIVLEHEQWASVKNFIVSLSNQAHVWKEGTPVKNFHILRILRRAAQEGNEVSIRQLTDLSYELKRMFPSATANYDHFFDTLYEYNRLFSKCFERLPTPTVERIDECIDLLRTLIKLELLSLHPNETLTSMFINHVLRQLGWEEAVNTWMKFQSGLSCSNGVVSLLRYCVHQKDDASAQANVKILLHKAQNFLPHSKVHTLYAAVLVSQRKYDEAEEYFKANKESIDRRDCVPVMKLMNALKYNNVDEDFNLKFPELCLKYTDLKNDSNEVSGMKTNAMRICEIKNLAPLGLKLFDLFKNYEIQWTDDEKKKLWDLVEKHNNLARRWMYEPKGMLRLNEDDDIVKGTDVYRIQKELSSDVQQISSRLASV